METWDGDAQSPSRPGAVSRRYERQVVVYDESEGVCTVDIENHLIELREQFEDEAASRRARYNRRRAAQLGAIQGNKHESQAYEELLRRGVCELCGAAVSIQVDHIEALSAGGAHGWENFAGLCGSCNARKSIKPLLKYLLDAADTLVVKTTKGEQ